jgi:DNA-binding CsgD family transcriptional regulator
MSDSPLGWSRRGHPNVAGEARVAVTAPTGRMGTHPFRETNRVCGGCVRSATLKTSTTAATTSPEPARRSGTGSSSSRQDTGWSTPTPRPTAFCAPMTVCGSVPHASKLRADARLQHVIDRALASNGADGCGNSFLCVRPSGRRPYIVHVLPLDETAFASPRPQNRAMIVIVDPDLEPEPPASLLPRLYGLTRSEAEIALMVLRGQGRNRIADQLSLSLATVKTHLRHVVDKTGTHAKANWYVSCSP